LLTVTFKPLLAIDYEAPVDIILQQVMEGIEQNKERQFTFKKQRAD